MKRKMLKRLLTSAFACMFIANGLITTTVRAVGPKTGEENQVLVPNLNPTPENLEVVGDGFKITSSINLVGEEEADENAVNALREFLTANNIEINSENDPNSTTLIIGEVDDDIPELDEALNWLFLLPPNKLLNNPLPFLNCLVSNGIIVVAALAAQPIGPRNLDPILNAPLLSAPRAPLKPPLPNNPTSLLRLPFPNRLLNNPLPLLNEPLYPKSLGECLDNPLSLIKLVGSLNLPFLRLESAPIPSIDNIDKADNAPPNLPPCFSLSLTTSFDL